MSQWYYAKDGNQHGPYDSDDMRLAVTSGELSAQDMVWREGMADWAKIKDVQDFAHLIVVTAAPAAQPVQAQPVPEAQYQSQPQAQPLQYQQAYSAESQIMFTPTAMSMMRQTKPWVRLIGVICLVVAGLIVLGVLVLLIIGAIGASSGGRNAATGAAFMMGFAAVYFLVALIPLFLGIFLNRYANQIGKLLTLRQTAPLERALEAQRSFWRLAGILTLIVVCLYGLVFLLAVGGAVFRF